MKGERRSLLLADFMHLPAATLMSAPTSIEAYDAQMLDFPSDPDVPMNITGSAEFFAEALMDHDGHLVAASYSEHPSVEVDMEEYVGDNEEYEMADETAEFQPPPGDELLDIEVYDASHAPSPLVPPHPLQPPTDIPIVSEHSVSTSRVFSEHTTPELRTDAESEVYPAHPGHQGTDTPHVEPSASGEDISSEAVALEPPHLARAQDVPPTSESHEQPCDSTRPSEQPFDTPAPAAADKEAEQHISTIIEKHPVSSVARDEKSEQQVAELAVPSSSAQDAYNSGSLVQVEKTVDQVPDPVTEKEAVVNPLHISDGIYIDPPPVVLLSVVDPSEPGFALFSQSHVEGLSTQESRDSQKTFPLLFGDRPTLYYEPLSSVFEALRQDEVLLSRIPHSFEGELVLDAYDLQLVVSEDNVHSREISLHDLNILHDGSDIAGPLRLLLRAIVPRFIIRYYALQEQIQQLNVAINAGEEHDEGHHEHYDADEEPHQPRQEEATILSSVLPPEGLTGAEEHTEESIAPPEPAEEISEENYEPDDISGVPEPAVDEVVHVLEGEGVYEGTNAGDEVESAKHHNLDADQAHSDDIDTPTTVAEQESKFGGEQTEYLDYVQPEEYDERYAEDLPERVEGDFDVQYGEPAHYEGEGKQGTPTTADETQATIPHSDEDQDDKSTVTSTPVRAVPEPELNEPVDDNATHEPVPLEQNCRLPSSEELPTNESTDEVVHAQVPGNRDTNATQTNVSSIVDESDSNFLSILEREADAELDQTFIKQSGQEGSIEATFQQDDAWDEWDDEDAEGEDEEGWIDPDAVSNESSVTLSSKGSSKRNYEEVDPNEEVYTEDPRSSPGPKRPRVQ